MAQISDANNTFGHLDEHFSEEELDGYLGRMFYGFICGLVIFFVIGAAIVKGVLTPLGIPKEASMLLFFSILMGGGLWVGIAFAQIQKYKLIAFGGLALLAGLLFTVYTFSGMEMPSIDDGIEDLVLVSEVESKEAV